jgi:hypothetical protein
VAAGRRALPKGAEMTVAHERTEAGRLKARAAANEGLGQTVVGAREVTAKTGLSGASTGNRHSRCLRLT